MNWKQRLARWFGREPSDELLPHLDLLTLEIDQQIICIAHQLLMSSEEVKCMFLRIMAEEYIVQERQWYSLTERGKEVTRLVCQGVTDEEIAQALHVTYHRLRAHLRKLLMKFDLTIKYELRNW